MCDIEKIELMWLLFTGNIPRSVFCERRSQKTRDILTIEQKIMNKQGSMIIKNVNDVINDVFEVTGFSDILTIE